MQFQFEKNEIVRCKKCEFRIKYGRAILPIVNLWLFTLEYKLNSVLDVCCIFWVGVLLNGWQVGDRFTEVIICLIILHIYDLTFIFWGTEKKKIILDISQFMLNILIYLSADSMSLVSSSLLNDIFLGWGTSLDSLDAVKEKSRPSGTPGSK